MAETLSRGILRPCLPVGTAATADAADAALMRAIQTGDVQALGELYDRYRRRAVAVASRVLGEDAAAEDVAHDAFLAVWRRAYSYQPDRGPVRSWLFAVVRHKAIDRLRATAVHRSLDAAAPLADPTLRADDALDRLAAAADGERVRRALAALPGEQRRAIELAYFAGLSQSDIAARLGVPLGTVKGRVRLGLHKLRAALDDLEPERHGIAA